MASEQRRIGIGSWTIIIVLVALLAASLAFAYYGWTYDGGEALPVSLLIPMGLGIFFSLVVGVGLMMLVYHSSRRGYDDAVERTDHDDLRKP